MAKKTLTLKGPLIKKTRPKEMKAWQDCQWLRVQCGKDECPICGRIKRDRERHIKKGEDPDSMEAMFKDVGNVFKETLAMLKKDAAKHGIDLDNLDKTDMPESPEPEDFPLYNKAYAWRQGIYEIAEASDDVSSAWLYSEAGEDLLWYANTLMAKIFRQLSNVREMEQGEEYMDLEYNYTGYVLGEVFHILDKALKQLNQDDGPQAAKFNLARLTLDGIRDKLNNP